MAGEVTEASVEVRRSHRTWVVAVAWGAVVAGVVGAATVLDRLPAPSGPTGVGPHVTRPATLAFVVVFAVGLVVARRRPGAAAAILAAGSCGVALVTAVSQPVVALAVGAAFGVSAVAMSWVWAAGRPARVVARASTATLAVVALGATGMWAAYDYRWGPTHPASTVAGLPAPIDWVWVGGTTDERAEVVAKLDHDDPDAVRLLVAEDADLADAEPVEGVAVDGLDSTVLRFEVNGLAADEEHHYALEVEGEVSSGAGGRFRTMPAGPSSFTLAVSGCARTGSNGQVFDTIRERDPLLYINTGDFHYGDITTDSPDRFREEFDAALAAPAQSALYRSTSTLYTWDDHDFGGNNSSSVSASRPAAQQVYREYVPHHPLADGVTGDDGVYQSVEVGRARIIATDLRSHRSPQEVPDGPAKTMLGLDQLRWFEDELAAAADQDQVVIWVSSTPWIGAPDEGEDDWTGYAHERGHIADVISDLDLAGQMVMLGGDAHMVALDDGTNSDYSSDQSGGFPSLQAGALDRRGSTKGGPYSAGVFPGGGQFGEVEFHDDGETVEVVLRGLDHEATVIVEDTFDVTPTGR